VDRSTIVVFVGLLGDIFVMLFFMFFGNEEERRSEIICSLVFTAVIAVGVFGEFIYGSEAERRNIEIQAIFSADTARLEGEAATANERAAQAEKETAELYALTAPCRLTLDQQKAIRQELNKFAGRRVIVSSYGLDGEGAGLGTQIIYILNASHIYVVDQLASTTVYVSHQLSQDEALRRI